MCEKLIGNTFLVSILLLTYNHERYIGDCILSILEQDYSNMELIVLDDASKDNTVTIINTFEKKIKSKFQNFVFLKNKKNSGNIPHNVNLMLKQSKGSYIKIFSGDDIMGHDCISKLMRCLVEYPQCSVVHSNRYIVDDDYRKGSRDNRIGPNEYHKKSEIEDENIFERLMYGNCVAAPTVLMRRELFLKYGLFDETISYEDYEYWLRIAWKKEKFYYLNECLVYYRKGTASITNFRGSGNKKKIKIGMFADGTVINRYMRYLPE